MGKEEERGSLQHPNLKYLLASSLGSSLESWHRRKTRRVYEWQGPEFMTVLDLLNAEAPSHFKRLKGSQAGYCGPVLFRQVLDLQSTRVTHPQAFLESATPYAETIPGREEERCSWFQSQTCGLFTPFIPSCLPPPLFRANYFLFQFNV